METIKVNHWSNIPEKFTGIVIYPSETKEWRKNGSLHREDGPAVEFPNGEKRWYINGLSHREDGPALEYADGEKFWYLEGIYYKQINLNDFVVLDSYQGRYDLMWYKLLDENEIIEYPDLPGLIEKWKQEK